MGAFTLHSIDLTLGSPDARARPEHLVEIRDVLQAMGADELSDHFAYSRVEGRRLHDFAPLWRVEEQVDLLCGNVDFVQEQLGVRLVLENVACLFDPGGDLTASELANEVSRRTGCGLLLDISNVLINEINGFCVAADEFAELELDRWWVCTWPGASWSDGIMWDAHSSPVPTSRHRVAGAPAARHAELHLGDHRARRAACRTGPSCWTTCAAVRAVVDRVTLAQYQRLTPASVAMSAPPTVTGRFRPEAVLASAPAMAVLGRAGRRAAPAGYANQVPADGPADERTLARLALGSTSTPRTWAERSGPTAVDDLVEAGAADLVDGDGGCRASPCTPSGPSLVLLPRDDGLAPDRVYFGRDTDVAGGAGPPVGPGSAARWPTWAPAPGRWRRCWPRSTSGWWPPTWPRGPRPAPRSPWPLNPGPDGSPGPAWCAWPTWPPACVPGAFDLVTANPPWVPGPGRRGGHAPHLRPRRGPPASSCPGGSWSRRPGCWRRAGVAVVLGIDVTWTDGSRPLVALARGLRRLGHEVAVLADRGRPTMWPDPRSRPDRPVPDGMAAGGPRGSPRRPPRPAAPT